jgi:tetratricopeptide (TPR) repeat protein
MTMETEAGTPPPQTAEDYERRAWLHYARKDRTQAEADFRKALGMNAGLVDSAYGLGMTLKAAGDFDQAKEPFQSVLKLLDEGAVKDGARAKILRALTRAQISFLARSTPESA